MTDALEDRREAYLRQTADDALALENQTNEQRAAVEAANRWFTQG